MIKGARKACEIVGYSLGPNGDNVAFRDQAGFCRSIRDGIKIIDQIKGDSVAEHIGVSLIRDGSKQTATLAGDGTTSTAVMTGCLLDVMLPLESREACERLNPEPVVEEIRKMAKPVKSMKDLQIVAKISANNNQAIGDLVGETVWKAGASGVVSVELNGRQENEAELLKGYVNDGGSMSPLFLRNRRQLDLEDALVVIIDQSVEHIDDIKELLQQYMESVLPITGSPMVIVCNNMVGSAMATILQGHDVASAKGEQFPIYVVKSPNREPAVRYEMLDDLRIVVGTKQILSVVGGNNPRKSIVSRNEITDYAKAHKATEDQVRKYISDRFLARFGVCDVRIEGDRAAFIPKSNPDEKAKADRLKMLKDQLAKTEAGTGAYSSLEDRIARIEGALGKIKIWGQTETEKSYLYELYDDAVRACFCALRDGVVPGAGVAYQKAMAVDTQLANANFLFQDKLGVNGRNIINENEKVIEPATVPINVIRNSFSICEQLIRTRYVIE